METSKENREPRHSWITLAGATVVMFLLIGYTRCNGLVYIELLDMFNEGPVKTSLFQTFFSITVAVAGPIMGYVSDRVSAHWIVVTAGLTAAVSCIGASFAPNLIIITVTYGAIMGGFKETTGSYSPGFHLAGACYGISSLAAVVSRIHWSTIKKRHNK